MKLKRKNAELAEANLIMYITTKIGVNKKIHENSNFCQNLV